MKILRILWVDILEHIPDGKEKKWLFSVENVL